MNLFNILADTDLCTSEAGYRLFGLAGYALDILQIAVPIILIIMGTIDLVRALVAQKNEQMKKAQSTLIKRVIIGVVIFFVPMAIKFVVGMLGDKMNSPCMTSFLNPDEAMAKANEIRDNRSSGGSSSANNNIVSQSDCEAQGKVIITDPVQINLNGTNCVNEINLNEQTQRIN